jgi:hypothetical protein
VTCFSEASIIAKVVVRALRRNTAVEPSFGGSSTTTLRTRLGRETQIKWWKRKWKLALIEKDNPTWRDLYDDFLLPPKHRRPDDDEPQ